MILATNGMKRIAFCAGALLVAAATAAAAQAPPLEWARLAERIVERMALQPGERVLLVGQPETFAPLVRALRERIARTGAVDLGVLRASGDPMPGEPGTPFVAAAAGRNRAGLAELFREVDVAIMLPLANGPAYDAMQDVLRTGRGRTVHFHWFGAHNLSSQSIPDAPGMHAVHQRAVLETDYATLRADQQAFESAARVAEVRVTTSAGTNLRFRIGDRPVTLQDGDASAARVRRTRNLIDREIELPPGAVRVAPLEATVSGTIALPASTWNGQPVRDLVLRFAEGRVVEVRAAEGAQHVEAELRAGGAGAYVFREFALGMNPLLAIPADRSWIPYYGYGAGVVRLSLGDNTELGGATGGGYVRWNFFPDATVRIGDDVWVADGRLAARRAAGANPRGGS